MMAGYVGCPLSGAAAMAVTTERDRAIDSAVESTAQCDRLRKINTDLVEALVLVLPLAKGYAPKGQTDSAKRTCRSWIASAEATIAKANGSTAP